MRKRISRFLFGVLVCCFSVAIQDKAAAQAPGAAQAEAQARLVCGSGTVLNATYLPGGLLQVTCQTTGPQGSLPNELPTQLQGTALTTAATGAVLTVVVLAAVLGGEDNATTTSSSSSTGQ